MNLSVALMQIDISFGNPEENYRKVEAWFKEAMKKHVDLVVLPELWTTGYDLERLDEIADENAATSISMISNLAKQYKVHVVAGSVAKKVNDQFFNTLLVINRDGKLVKEYNKAHLFRLMNEEKYLMEGSQTGAFQLDNHKCAGIICYDIRFPEWVRTHMLDNTEILFVVAEWPKPRIDHWRALLISRAIENQCFVVACNRSGADPDNEFGGHSIIIGPWGEVIMEAGEEETILYGNVEVDQVAKVRETIPIFTDRRPDIYKLN